MFASAYMGQKRCFSNAFTPHATYLARVVRTLERAAPHLSLPMYAGANMGHPSRGEGFVVCRLGGFRLLLGLHGHRRGEVR
jgi:hypothetical protein